MSRLRVSVLVICAVLVSVVKSRRHLERAGTCGNDEACSVGNQAACCSQENRCCSRDPNKVNPGICPVGEDANTDGLLKCMFDDDCPNSGKCCNRKKMCWVKLDKVGQCPRFRPSFPVCKPCDTLGTTRSQGGTIEYCCPDSFTFHQGVCQPAVGLPPTSIPAVDGPTPGSNSPDAKTPGASSLDAATAGASSPDAKPAGAASADATAAGGSPPNAMIVGYLAPEYRDDPSPLTPNKMYCIYFLESNLAGKGTATVTWKQGTYSGTNVGGFPNNKTA